MLPCAAPAQHQPGVSVSAFDTDEDIQAFEPAKYVSVSPSREYGIR